MGSKFRNRLKKITSSPIFKGILKSVPFGIGDLVGGVIDETAKSKAGTISKEELTPRAAKMVFYAGLIYSTLHCILKVFDA